MLSTPPSTPGLSVSEQIKIEEPLRSLREENDRDESVTKRAIGSSGIIPASTSSRIRVGRHVAPVEGDNVIFIREVLPKQSDDLRQILTPKPDCHYGHKRDIFDNHDGNATWDARIGDRDLGTKQAHVLGRNTS